MTLNITDRVLILPPSTVAGRTGQIVDIATDCAGLLHQAGW
jgi:hypothetical protein